MLLHLTLAILANNPLIRNAMRSRFAKRSSSGTAMLERWHPVTMELVLRCNFFRSIIV